MILRIFKKISLIFYLVLFTLSLAIAEQSGNQTEKIPISQNKDKSQQAALADEVIKDFITSLEKYALNRGTQLKVSHNYQLVENTDGSFKTVFNQFEIINPNNPNDKIIFSPVTIKIFPIKNDLLKVKFLFPEKVPIITKGKKEGTITINNQEIVGNWNTQLKAYTNFKCNIGKLTLLSEDASVKITAQPINGQYSITAENSKDDWRQSIKGYIKDFTISISDQEEGNSTETITHLSNISLTTNTTGNNLKEFIKTKKILSQTEIMDSSKNISTESVKKILSALDTIIYLINSSNGEFLIGKIQINDPKNLQLDLNNFKITANYKKNSKKDNIIADSSLTLGPFYYNSSKPETSSRYRKGSCKEFKLYSKVNSKLLPSNFFKSIGEKISTLESANDTQKQEQLLNRYIEETFKTIFSLINKGSYEIDLKGIDLKGKNPTNNVSLASAWLSGGYDLNKGHSNSIRLSVGYSGLITALFTRYFKGANFHIQLMNLPPILELLGENPLSDYKNNPQHFKAGIVGNFMTRLEKNPLHLGAMISLIGVPETLTTMDLNMQTDVKSVFKAVGSLNIRIENPDNLMAIVESLTKDPSAQQLLATIFAFGERRDINGKVVEALNLSLTPDGKIILNNKDITKMFFPQTQKTETQDTGTSTNVTKKGVKSNGK